MIDRITRAVPDRLKAAVNPWYLTYRGIRADRQHEPVPIDREQSSRAPHVLLIVVDAFRLDATLRLPFEWSAAVAPATWTFPSITSMHTGTYPHQHGAVARTRGDEESYAMPEQATEPVLPMAFERAGWDTYAGLAFAMPLLAVQGWYQRHRVFPDVRAERVLQAYRRWRTGRERTFAYLHLGDLHAPLDPPAEYVAARGIDQTLPNLATFSEYTDSFDAASPTCRYYRQQRLELYHAAKTYLEQQLAEYLLPLTEDTIVIVTGDHGEAHWEHAEVDRQMTDSRPNYGVGHGGTPLDVVARVPVAVSTPTCHPSIQGGVASLVDLPRTLADLAFSGAVDELPGRSWTAPIPPDRIAMCEAPRYGVERKAAYRRHTKVIESKADEVVLGASVAPSVPGDQFGTVSTPTIDELRDALVWSNTERTAETGAYLREQLEALGYA